MEPLSKPLRRELAGHLYALPIGARLCAAYLGAQTQRSEPARPVTGFAIGYHSDRAVAMGTSAQTY